MNANIALEEVLPAVLRRYQWLAHNHRRNQECGPSSKHQIFIPYLIINSISDYDNRTSKWNCSVYSGEAYKIFGGYKLKIYQRWAKDQNTWKALDPSLGVRLAPPFSHLRDMEN